MNFAVPEYYFARYYNLLSATSQLEVNSQAVNKPLRDAIQCGDENKVKELIAPREGKVCKLNEFKGRSILADAIQLANESFDLYQPNRVQRLNIIELLLNLDNTDSQSILEGPNLTALDYAFTFENIKPAIIKVLCDSNCDVSAKVYDRVKREINERPYAAIEIIKSFSLFSRHMLLLICIRAEEVAEVKYLATNFPELVTRFLVEIANKLTPEIKDILNEIFLQNPEMHI